VARQGAVSGRGASLLKCAMRERAGSRLAMLGRHCSILAFSEIDAANAGGATASPRRSFVMKVLRARSIDDDLHAKLAYEVVPVTLTWLTQPTQPCWTIGPSLARRQAGDGPRVHAFQDAMRRPDDVGREPQRVAVALAREPLSRVVRSGTLSPIDSSTLVRRANPRSGPASYCDPRMYLADDECERPNSRSPQREGSGASSLHPATGDPRRRQRDQEMK
jgi:hypothetical protein